MVDEASDANTVSTSWTAPSTDSLFEVKPKAVKRSKTRKNSLDSSESIALHKRMMVWFDQESARQAANRYQMALDEDYYDNLQWDDDDARVLMERGQAPVVYNEIKNGIDWMIGTERRSRIDFKIGRAHV